ncbi:hypothetical protein [Streptomyces cinereospinus]|uniref:Uncharacterized protein n=1 Tax=Streptomyces cinereospinus TaxID=285561 RepID=A0ABV5N5E5_9ACTN
MFRAPQRRRAASRERARSWLHLCSGDLAALFKLPVPPPADLCSGDLAALFELPVPPPAEWLERTYEVVPAGRELAGVAWDEAAADLLPARRTQGD